MGSILKWSLMGACFLFSPMQAMAQFSVTLPYKQIAVEMKGGKAVFSGALVNGVVGKPAMPHYLVSFLLPPDVDFKDVTVSLVNGVDQEVPGNFLVNPVRPPYDDNGNPKWPKGLALSEGKDMTIYGKDAAYPADYQGNVVFGKMRQYNIVDITINPYLWNPVTGKLRMITNGTLMVSMPKSVLSTAASVRNVPRCGWAERLLQKNVANFSEVQQYGAAPVQVSPLQSKAMSASAAASTITGTYVVITTNAILNSSSAIGSYMQYLRIGGIQVSVITENNIRTETNWAQGATADACADNIRVWLQTYYQAQNIQYVLLVGNPDPTNINMPDVPMKMVGNSRGYDALAPSDHYYSNLQDDAGSLGTHGDVIVGRIPVYPDPNTGSPNVVDLEKILQKTSSYFNAYDIEWRRFAMLPVVPLDGSPADDYLFGDTIMNKVLNPAGWGYRRLYEPYNAHSYDFVKDLVNMNPLPEVTLCDYGTVATNWNTFNPGLVVWHTHGNSINAVGVLNSIGGGGSASSLNDQHPAIVYSASCETMYPEVSNNLGFETVLYNAVAFTGGTMSLYDDPETDLEGKLYANDIVTSGMSVGEALSDLRMTGSGDLAINLYGCPEIAVGLTPYLGPGPQNFKVQASSSSQINLSWTAVSGVSQYILERGDSNATKEGGWTTAIEVSAPASGFLDFGLQARTKYKYRLYTLNNAGRSGYTRIDSAGTKDANNQSVMPQTPAGLVGTPYDNAADLHWTAVSGATAYNIKRSISSGGPFVTVGQSPSSPYRGIDLVNGSKYYFVVTAVNFYGESGQSSVVSITPAAQQITSPPSNLHLAAPGEGGNPVTVTPNYLVIGWTDNCDHELYYDVNYYYIRNILGDTTHLEKTDKVFRNAYVAGIGGSSLPFENNTMVSFRIRDGNDLPPTAYTSYSTGYTSAGTPPGTPTSFTAAAPDPFTINLKWTPANSNPKADSFEVYAKFDTVTDKFIYPIVKLPADSTQYTYTVFSDNVGKKMAFTIRGVHIGADGYASNSAFYNKVSITPPPYACKAPGNLGGHILSTTQIRITWLDSSTNETGFAIERSTNYGNFVQIDTVPANSTSYQNNGLSANVVYTYRVRAIRRGQPYPYSAYTNELQTEIATPVEPMMGLQGQEVSSSAILLYWYPIFFNMDSNIVQRSTDNSNWTTIAILDGNAISYSNTGLSLNTTYYYRLRSKNVISPYYSPWSTLGPETMLPAPSNLSATSASSSQINLSWTDNSTDEDGFAIEQATSSSGPFVEIFEVMANVKTYLCTGLSSGTTYWFRVRGFRNIYHGIDYSSYSNTTSMATQGGGVPTAPSNLTATAVSRSQINLAWNDNSSNESGFYIERAPSGSSSFTQIGSVGANVKTYSNTGLAAGTTYQYRVRAYNGSGNSGYSNTASTATYSNIAQGKTASASSVQSGNTAANGNDGNTGTRWCASSATMPQWWKVDLGASKTIGEVEIMFQATGSSGNCYNFTVETSADNNTWTTGVDKSTNTNTAQTQAYSFNATARYVRITIKKAPGTNWASLYEFRVFGK